MLLKETRPQTGLKLDTRGFACAAIAFPCLLLGFSEGAEYGWDNPLVFVMLAVGFVALAAFIYIELHHHDPLLRMQPLRRSATSASRCSCSGSASSRSSASTSSSRCSCRRVQGMGAAEAGRILLPMGIVAFITMNMAGGCTTSSARGRSS